MSTMKGSLLVVAAVVSTACVDHRCPKGYDQKGDTCYRIKDAGTDASAELDADTNAIEVDGGHGSEADAPNPTMEASTDDTERPLDAGDTEEASTDLCQGSGGAPVCAGAIMHHCSAAGITERTEPCPTSQQCQDGLALDACAPCLRGTFQCKDARLERCANDGQRWELGTTCDSAALCNATAGACTDKACTATTRICDDDTLTGCNATLTALEPIKQCEPGLCDQAQGECDVCVANAKACEQDTVVTCDANGRRETRTTCPAATPKCTGSGNCVQCVRNTDCTGEHELCTGNRCVVQPYCGDGMKDIGEECDPGPAGENIWTCSTQCKRTTTYTWCSDNLMDSQGFPQGVGCATGELCLFGVCSRVCDLSGECPTPPMGNAFCAAAGACVASGCIDSSQCAPGLVCVPERVCMGCNDSRPCTSGTCQLAAPTDLFKKCLP